MHASVEALGTHRSTQQGQAFLAPPRVLLGAQPSQPASGDPASSGAAGSADPDTTGTNDSVSAEAGSTN